MFTFEQKNFLHLLAYMYAQQAKYLQALMLFRLLRLHDPKNMQITLSLCFCLHNSGKFDEAIKVLDTIDLETITNKEKVVYYFVKSKALWELKKVQESREMLSHYLKYRVDY